MNSIYSFESSTVEDLKLFMLFMQPNGIKTNFEELLCLHSNHFKPIVNVATRSGIYHFYITSGLFTHIETQFYFVYISPFTLETSSLYDKCLIISIIPQLFSKKEKELLSAKISNLQFACYLKASSTVFYEKSLWNAKQRFQIAFLYQHHLRPLYTY